MTENERLYLKTWEYNAARILTELAKIIINNGGKVKPLLTAIISNRSITVAKQEYTEKIEQLTELEKTSHNEKRAATIKTYSEKLTELKKVDNTPVAVTHTSYINFVYNGFYFYYQVDGNPFFDFFYTKTPVNNGKYSQDACIEEDRKEWLNDCFFSATCSKSDIKEGANFIFNMLVGVKPSIIRRDCKRRRVSNLYDGGYHYETVYSPERFRKIDF